jgi:hypothetical protein
VEPRTPRPTTDDLLARCEYECGAHGDGRWLLCCGTGRGAVTDSSRQFSVGLERKSDYPGRAVSDGLSFGPRPDGPERPPCANQYTFRTDSSTPLYLRLYLTTNLDSRAAVGTKFPSPVHGAAGAGGCGVIVDGTPEQYNIAGCFGDGPVTQLKCSGRYRSTRAGGLEVRGLPPPP